MDYDFGKQIPRNNRTQSCVGWLHLQGNFTERGSKFIQKTPNTSTCAKVESQELLQVQQQHSQQQRQHSESASSRVRELTRVCLRPDEDTLNRIEAVQSYPCKTKTSQEIRKSLQKFLDPTRKPKVIFTENSLEFGKACEELT